MTAIDMGAYLYSLLPGSTRERDGDTGGQLQQLCNVLGSGLGDIRGDADKIPLLINVDDCPLDQLPRLAEMLGFDFPFDLPEDQQRAFVRSAVALYRLKGTSAALRFVVSRVIGNGFALDIANEDYLAKTFDVQLTAAQDNVSLTAFESKVAYLVGLYSPAGLVPNIVVLYFFSDTAPTAQRSDAHHTSTQIDAWRMNLNARCNTIKPNGDIVSVNNAGSTPLTI